MLCAPNNLRRSLPFGGFVAVFLISVVALILNTIQVSDVRLLNDDWNYTSGSAYGFDHQDEDTSNATTRAAARSIALLVSFPNSGTSYTLINTLVATNRSVASNYVAESKSGALMDPDLLPGGPFLLSSSREVPTFVLTKTHCSMRNNLRDFERACRSVRGVVNKTSTAVTYPMSAVGKVVHLVRHPQDNIVARMHHGMRKFRDYFPVSVNSSLSLHDEKVAFRKWCSFIDRKFGIFADTFNLSPEAQVLIRSVPCYSDLLHYVAWHNLAAEVIDRHQIPYHVLHYEDYTIRYQQTIQDLFAFLQLEQVHKPKPFFPGKTYDYYFTEKENHDLTRLLWEVASPRTRRILLHYFQNLTSVKVSQALEKT